MRSIARSTSAQKVGPSILPSRAFTTASYRSLTVSVELKFAATAAQTLLNMWPVGPSAAPPSSSALICSVAVRNRALGNIARDLCTEHVPLPASLQLCVFGKDELLQSLDAFV